MRWKILKYLFIKGQWKKARKEPKHIVVETDKAVYVDGKRIDFVIKDSVQTEPFGEWEIVTLSFVARGYLKNN